MLAHEIGHVLRLGNALDEADEPCGTGIMGPGGSGTVTEALCRKVKEEVDRPSGGGPGDPGDGGGSNPGGGADPGGGGTDRCTDHPDTPGCPGYCANNPDAPGCGTVTTSGVVCIPTPGVGIAWICIPLAPIPGGDGRDGNGWTTSATATASPGATYGFTLGGASQKITVSLTGLSRDMDCRIHENPGPASGGAVPRSARVHRCPDNFGTWDESWSGVLGAGAHSVRVYPFQRRRTGDYTITVSGDGAGGFIGGSVAPPPPPATNPPSDPSTPSGPSTPSPPSNPSPPSSSLRLPSIPDFELPSGGSVDTTFPAATDGTPPYVYNVSGLPPGISFSGSTRRAAGTLPSVTANTDYNVTYSVIDNASGSASVSFVAAAPSPPPPPPPRLSLPSIPNFRLPSAGVVNTTFPAATGGSPAYSFSVSGLPPGITFYPSTRGASGTLPTVSSETTYTITYTVTDSANATASVSFTATVVP